VSCLKLAGVGLAMTRAHRQARPARRPFLGATLASLFAGALVLLQGLLVVLTLSNLGSYLENRPAGYIAIAFVLDGFEIAASVLTIYSAEAFRKRGGHGGAIVAGLAGSVVLLCASAFWLLVLGSS
jgi:uncharacterized membrane protein HdeD (DUF308 family)